ncbi:hypothetical protein ARMSODRAFT_999983 [Armillaria solidipes]|uniref:Secreted protein n=1 Tax=Armillaria solidipes TaxID=1076256 RepID=A0A2H3BXL3_9AGAR|nr:hypothetical protein ARMSODRAFT_999983 [Armillaria solidipes]
MKLTRKLTVIAALAAAAVISPVAPRGMRRCIYVTVNDLSDQEVHDLASDIVNACAAPAVDRLFAFLMELVAGIASRTNKSLQVLDPRFEKLLTFFDPSCV